MKAIHLRDADLGYGGKAVLRGVTVSIKEGDVCHISGANGSGKTTLGLALLGLLPLLRGERDTGFIAPSYVPQISRLDAQYPLSLEALVAMGLPGYSSANMVRRWKHRAGGRAAVRETLARVGLEGKERYHFQRTSGGEFQRALIARALVSNPDIILLDEPFANIDREGRKDIKGLLLRESEEKGITLIIIDHHENVDFCSNCLDIRQGRVESDGSH